MPTNHMGLKGATHMDTLPEGLVIHSVKSLLGMSQFVSALLRLSERKILVLPDKF